MSKDVLDKIELMIETINKIHADFSQIILKLDTLKSSICLK
jgi:hypothetical protein